MVMSYGGYSHFQQYLSFIVAVSFLYAYGLKSLIVSAYSVTSGLILIFKMYDLAILFFK
jgi:hypothetical protein